MSYLFKMIIYMNIIFLTNNFFKALFKRTGLHLKCSYSKVITVQQISSSKLNFHSNHFIKFKLHPSILALKYALVHHVFWM